MLILPLAETLFPFDKHSLKWQKKLDELTKLSFCVSARLVCVKGDFIDKKSPSDLPWGLVWYSLKGALLQWTPICYCTSLSCGSRGLMVTWKFYLKKWKSKWNAVLPTNISLYRCIYVSIYIKNIYFYPKVENLFSLPGSYSDLFNAVT